jgi:rod shape-determining protein MreD
MSSSIYIAIPLMAVLVVLQSTISPHLPVLGVVPQLLFLSTIAWGLLHGLRQGIAWAFVAGLFVDMFSASPLGATSLALMAAVAVAVLVRQSFPESRFLMPMLLGGLATIVFWFVYIVLLRLLMPLLINNLDYLAIEDLARGAHVPNLMDDITGNYGFSGPILQFIMIMALVHTLLILPVYWAFYTLERVLRPQRVEI